MIGVIAETVFGSNLGIPLTVRIFGFIVLDVLLFVHKKANVEAQEGHSLHMWCEKARVT